MKVPLLPNQLGNHLGNHLGILLQVFLIIIQVVNASPYAIQKKPKDSNYPHLLIQGFGQQTTSYIVLIRTRFIQDELGDSKP